MVKAQKWTLVKVFEGHPRPSDFRLDEEDISESKLKDGEVLVEALYLSVDPYMRLFRHLLKEGITMFGEQVAKVNASKSSKFPVGTLVCCQAGWQTHSIINDSDLKLRAVPQLGGLSPSTAIGIMGMPGATAYFGLLELCHPKAGETVLVNAAAGAVGSAVGQIAKVKGCKMIGFAGSDDKVAWLKTVGFDYVFNYKKISAREALNKAAPEGVDVYFDNVGGEFTNQVIPHMKEFGRISVCGSISSYNDTSPPTCMSAYFFLPCPQSLPSNTDEAASCGGFHCESLVQRLATSLC